jgi:hypothetical protein
VVASTVVVVDDGRPIKALLADRDDGSLEQHAQAAADSTRCHGIGIACDVAGERLIELGRAHRNDPAAYVREVTDLLSMLLDAVRKSMRLESGNSAPQAG